MPLRLAEDGSSVVLVAGEDHQSASLLGVRQRRSQAGLLQGLELRLAVRLRLRRRDGDQQAVLVGRPRPGRARDERPTAAERPAQQQHQDADAGEGDQWLEHERVPRAHRPSVPG